MRRSIGYESGFGEEIWRVGMSRNRNGSNPILCAKSHDRSIDWIGATFQISSMNQTGKFIFLLARFHWPTSVERSEACPRPPTTGRAALGAAAQLVGRLKELKWADRDPRWRARGWMLPWRALESHREPSRGFKRLREALSSRWLPSEAHLDLYLSRRLLGFAAKLEGLRKGRREAAYN